MPNTLAHLGVQGLITRKLIDNPDLKWIYVGCIIPDLPWILRRTLKTVMPAIDMYSLINYATAQSSLFLCLVLCLGLASFADNYWKTFKILGLNSFLHLFLDAFQIKWANGVHFIAPFNWELISFSLFWPESFPTYMLTAFGLAYLIFNWNRCIANRTRLTIKPISRIVSAVSIITVYFALPFFILSGPEKADNHFVKTLKEREERPGKYAEFDRRNFQSLPTGNILITYTGEEISIEGVDSRKSADVSVRGNFVTKDLIHASEYHVHSKWFRDKASYLGLFLVAVLWIWTPASKLLHKQN